jgi:predicted kinase
VREPFAQFIQNELSPRTLLIMCGLPATYKTETAEEISKIKGYPILRSDLIRLEVLKNEDIFDTKVAGNMQKRLSVYDELFKRAEDIAEKGEGGLILDATFVTRELRIRAAEIAAKTLMSFAILETSCPQDVSLSRIKRRTKEKYESNALTEEAYMANKNKFEKVDIDDLKLRFPNLNIIHFTVDTCHDLPHDWYIIEVEEH